MGCNLYLDTEDDDMLVFVEQWADEGALADRLRSEGTRVLLSALDLACEPPDVQIATIGGTKGIEYIAACRESGPRK